MEHLRSRISTFIKSDLKLDIEQCAIVHAVGNRVKFLGVWLGIVPQNKWLRRQTREIEKRRRVRGRLILRKKHLKETWDRQIGWLARKAWAQGVRQAARLLGSGRKAVEAMGQKAAQLAAEFVISPPPEDHTSTALANLRERVSPLRSGHNLPSRVEAAYNNLVLALETDIQAFSSDLQASYGPFSGLDGGARHFVPNLWLCPPMACWRVALGCYEQSWARRYAPSNTTTLVLLSRPALGGSEATWRHRSARRTGPRHNGAHFRMCYRK